MPLIVTADTHITDLPRDEHRWGLFDWLTKQADKYDAGIAILGDLTDAKDRHSAILTNRIADSFNLMATDHRVYFIPGNHDGIDTNNPFFEFLANIDGVRVIMRPELISLVRFGKCLFLPHTKDYEKDWGALDLRVDYIFSHQTYDGCLTENGTELSGIPPSIFAKTKARVISGDIHVPQRIGKNIEYVGAPYRIRFGDQFEPRVLLIEDDGSTKDLHFPTKNKVLVKLYNCRLDQSLGPLAEAAAKDAIKPGDQVKVRVELDRRNYADWPRIRAEVIEDARKLKIELTGPELIAAEERSAKGRSEADSSPPSASLPEEALAAYAKEKGLKGDLLKAGRGWLKEATGASK